MLMQRISLSDAAHQSVIVYCDHVVNRTFCASGVKPLCCHAIHACGLLPLVLALHVRILALHALQGVGDHIPLPYAVSTVSETKSMFFSRRDVNVLHVLLAEET